MRKLGLALPLAASLSLLSPARALDAQGVRVKAKEIVDDRFSAGMLSGGLKVDLVLENDGKETIKAARFLAKEAKDDTGASLLGKDRKEPSFETLDQQMKVRVELENPPRRAKSFRLSGKLELYVPSKDPNAVVKVPGALAKKDKPLDSKGLKAAKVQVTVLSKRAYADLKKSQKLDDAKIAEIRAEGKKHGVEGKEMDAMIEMAKAFQEIGDGDLPDSAVILSGKSAEMEKIVEVGLQKADGSEIDMGGRSSSSDSKTKSIVLQPREAPPDDAVLVFTILTDKAKVSVPVDLKEVPLP